jgi:large subunit ribosomal protein L28
MSRRCMLTGKRANNGFSVSFSHRRTKKLQQVNLQWKKIWDPEQGCYVRLKVSTKALKTISLKGVNKMAKEAGINLVKHRVEA